MNKIKLKLIVCGASVFALGLGAQANHFTGHFLEARAGGSFPFSQSEVNADPGAGQPTISNKFSTRGPLGLAGAHYIYNHSKVYAGMDLGVSFGADWFFGKSFQKENTPSPAEHYSLTQKDRYELALRTGSEQGMFYPFFKVGAVAGTWEAKALTEMGALSKKDLLWGATIGAGLDYKLHSCGSIGAVVEADWYANKTYDLQNTAGANFATFKTNPWALNVAVTYKVKLDHWF